MGPGFKEGFAHVGYTVSMPTKAMKTGASTPPRARVAGRLALADGRVFHGFAFGATGRNLAVTAEVVFNTAISGYQESLTDPSYTGQILVQTFPLIGNTGMNAEDLESAKIQVSGFVVRELAHRHSNFRATSSLEAELSKAGVLGIEGIDTRALTKALRSSGSTTGVITDRPSPGAGEKSISDAELVALARQAPSMAGANLVPLVGCASRQSWDEAMGEWTPAGSGASPTPQKRFKVLTLDCGAKRNILRNLTARGCDVTVVPHDMPAEEILRLYREKQIDGLFISNGPGDPAAVKATVNSLRTILESRKEHQMPVFGICLGHQLLALAMGATTYKLKFGHRGINQPIKNEQNGRVEITSQNHGFAVDATSLAERGGRATHIHLNDGTLAGFELSDAPVFCVQYHPEASPGPHDAGYLFDRFVTEMAARKG